MGQDGQAQLSTEQNYSSKLKVQYKFEYYEKIPIDELKNKTVFITGSFNNWKQRIPMTFNQYTERFEVIVELQPAKYQFKFIVDAEWKCCDLYQTVSDNSGNINNQVQVLYADDGQQENSNFQQLKQLENIFTTELPQNPHQIWNGFPTDLPRQVTKTPLNNYDIRKEYEPSVLLPLPDHVVLTHFFKQKKKNNMKICASTNRYRQKYITIILYEAMESQQMIDDIGYAFKDFKIE